jgi:hypothetical protein
VDEAEVVALARVGSWASGEEVLCVVDHQRNRVEKRQKVKLIQKKLWNQINGISMNVTDVSVT